MSYRILKIAIFIKITDPMSDANTSNKCKEANVQTYRA